jgi:hypothetical protein
MEQVIRRILGVDAKGGESQKFAALETRSIRQSERAPEGSTIHGARPAPILTALAGALTPWSEIRRAGHLRAAAFSTVRLPAWPQPSTSSRRAAHSR